MSSKQPSKSRETEREIDSRDRMDRANRSVKALPVNITLRRRARRKSGGKLESVERTAINKYPRVLCHDMGGV